MSDREEINKLVNLLLQAREVYYRLGSSPMSDAEFDELEETLKQMDPENNYFSTLGVQEISDSSGSKIRHSIPMLSMGKAKLPEEVVKWMDRLGLDEESEFCVQPKIDGLGATCFYREGKLVYTATRGDGTEGQDISHISPYLDDIPPSIGFTRGEVEVRGELYLPKNTDYDTGGRPLRNNCVGLINRKDDRDDLHHVRFVCYQIVTTVPSLLPVRESEKLELLTKEGFHTVEFHRINGKESLTEIYLDYLETDRDRWLYETDGLIITVDDSRLHEEIDKRWVVDHHHHYAIALKPPAAGKETSLTGVEWQISRQGNLIPVAQFESIELGGANLVRASLHNAQFTRDLMLIPGDRLIIERANDVIPYVRSNLSNQQRSRKSFIDPLIPRKCPVCSSALEERGVHLHCTNRECPERQIQSIIYWVKQSGMEQIAEGTIRALYGEGKVRSIRDLYTMEEADFKDLEGFGDKKITNFLGQTLKKRRMTSLEFLSKLGIPLVQKKALVKLGIQSLQDFYSFKDNTYIIGQNIISWRDDPGNREFLDELLEVLEIEESQSDRSKGEICLTGAGPLGRKELIKIAEEKGYTVGSSVTRNTAILVCDDPEGNSSKLQKARKMGITLMNYDDFTLL